jgi:mRNA-degrading endonuclease RelE of RelBE toxin-antitoxin system
MYSLIYKPGIKKALKNIKKSNSKNFFNEFKEVLENIAKDPYKAGIAYKGNLKGFYKYSYSDNPEYRIIYAVYDKSYLIKNLADFNDISFTKEDLKSISGIVDLTFVKTREECNNLYKQKKKYWQDKLR